MFVAALTLEVSVWSNILVTYVLYHFNTIVTTWTKVIQRLETHLTLQCNVSICMGSCCVIASLLYVYILLRSCIILCRDVSSFTEHLTWAHAIPVFDQTAPSVLCVMPLKSPLSLWLYVTWASFSPFHIQRKSLEFAGTCVAGLWICINMQRVCARLRRYVKVYLLPDKTKNGKRKTRVKKHTLHPIFDEVLKVTLVLRYLAYATIRKIH